MNPAEQTAISILKRLQEDGHTAYFAGGCVRDRLLDRVPKDFDIATSAHPEQVQALFPSTREAGKVFGVVLVVENGLNQEVATFRNDHAYIDGRHPESVSFGSEKEDAFRRDFTVNGMFYDPVTDRIIDYVNGADDLKTRTLRAIGDPADRFREDHLRLLRAARFSSVLEFGIEPATRKAIQEHADSLQTVSAERIRDEFLRLLTESPRPGDGLELLSDLGLLRVFLPEAIKLQGQDQPPQFHPEGDVWTHTVMMLNGMQQPSTELALAVLLHDIAKPLTERMVPSFDGSLRIGFPGHEVRGAKMADEILTRLRCSNRLVQDVTSCIKDHMRFFQAKNMNNSTIRKTLGDPLFKVKLELHRLDVTCSNGDLSNYEHLLQMLDNLEGEVPLPTPWLSGKDVMALGVPEGPQVGLWVGKAYDRQLEQQTSPEEIRNWIQSQLNADEEA